MRAVAFRLDHSLGEPSAAVEHEDRLGVTMKMLRAIETESPGEVSRCFRRYPHLATLVDNPYAFDGNRSRRLRALREHAVELAREHALDELGKAHTDLVGDDEQLAARARRTSSGQNSDFFSPGGLVKTKLMIL